MRVSQLDSVSLLMENPFFAIFNDMGFGKTVVTLTAIDRLIRSGDVKKALIVSTLLVSRDTWPEEIARWEHTSYLTFKFIEGNAKKRTASILGPEDVHIINQENFVWLVNNLGGAWPYDMLVFDDATGFKTHRLRNKVKGTVCTLAKGCAIFEHEKTYSCEKALSCEKYTPMQASEGCALKCEDFTPTPSRLKSCALVCNDFKSAPRPLTRFGAVCKIRPKIKRLVHLTGTPTSKELLDLWPLFFTLDAGVTLGRTFTHYRNRFFNQDHSGFSYTLKPGSNEFIFKIIAPLCATIESEAILPKLNSIEIPIDIGPEANKLYREFEKQFIIEVDEKTVEAPNSGVLAGKLLQICGGAVYTGENKDWLAIHAEKITAVTSLLARHAGEPILIGYGFGHELERLKKAFPQGVDIRDRKDAVKAWNAGEIPLMFAHPLSAGHGLNLQRGPGRVLIWFGLNWALDLNKQLNKRLYRPGQLRECFIYYLTVKGKADTRVAESLIKKDATQKDLLLAVRRDAAKVAPHG